MCAPVAATSTSCRRCTCRRLVLHLSKNACLILLLFLLWNGTFVSDVQYKPSFADFYRLDPSRRPRFPWPRNDPDCGHFNVSFLLPGEYAARGNPRMVLTSQGGSGNTWSRYILESLTGAFSGSIYGSENLTETFWGTLDHPSRGTSFIIKDHELNVEKYDWALLILRNPLEMTIADFHRRRTGNNNIGKAAESDFYSEIFNDFFSFKMDKMELFVSMWLQTGKVKHVISYENLLEDFESEVARMVWAGLPFSVDAERFGCLVRYREGSHRREAKDKRVRMKMPYNREQLRRVGDFVCKANKMISEKGFDPIDPKQYVRVMRSRFDFDEADAEDLLTQRQCGEMDRKIFTLSERDRKREWKRNLDRFTSWALAPMRIP